MSLKAFNFSNLIGDISTWLPFFNNNRVIVNTGHGALAKAGHDIDACLRDPTEYLKMVDDLKRQDPGAFQRASARLRAWTTDDP